MHSDEQNNDTSVEAAKAMVCADGLRVAQPVGEAPAQLTLRVTDDQNESWISTAIVALLHGGGPSVAAAVDTLHPPASSGEGAMLGQVIVEVADSIRDQTLHNFKWVRVYMAMVAHSSIFDIGCNIVPWGNGGAVTTTFELILHELFRAAIGNDDAKTLLCCFKSSKSTNVPPKKTSLFASCYDFRAGAITAEAISRGADNYVPTAVVTGELGKPYKAFLRRGDA